MARKKDSSDSSSATPADSTEETETPTRQRRRASRGSRESRRSRLMRERAQSADETTATGNELTIRNDEDLAADEGPAHDETEVALEPTEADEETDELDPSTERRRWILLTAFLGVSLLSMVGVSLYLADVVSQWEERADELTTVNYNLGTEIADAQDTIEAQTTRIDLLTTQLNTAKDRITELANETANYDDDRAYTAQQIEQLEGLASTGASVANALARCIDGEQQLVEYLQSAEDYEEEELTAYQESVNELCTAARDSNTEFQKLLNG